MKTLFRPNHFSPVFTIIPTSYTFNIFIISSASLSSNNPANYFTVEFIIVVAVRYETSDIAVYCGENGGGNTIPPK